jgi:hypothetical protein
MSFLLGQFALIFISTSCIRLNCLVVRGRQQIPVFWLHVIVRGRVWIIDKPE